MFAVSFIHKLYVKVAVNQLHSFLIVHKTDNIRFESVGCSKEGTQ